MTITMATISGAFVRPDLGTGAMTVYIEAATEGSRLTSGGTVIAGKYGVQVDSSGNASVTIPQLPQASILPADARWRIVMLVGNDTYIKEFTLSGDTTWGAIVDVSGTTITSSILAAALAAVSAVKIGTWQATTSYVSGQTVQAPDGSLIKSTTARTSRSTFDATEQTFWTPVSTTSGTLEQVALAGTYVAKGSQSYSVADYASLSVALTAIPDGATLTLPPGTYSANAITTLTKNVTIQGSGPRSSIIDASANAYAFTIPSPQAPVQVNFRDVGFIGSTSAQVRLSRDVISRAYFTGCRFSGFSANAIEALGTEVYLDRCSFDGNGQVATAKTGLYVD